MEFLAESGCVFVGDFSFRQFSAGSVCCVDLSMDSFLHKSALSGCSIGNPPGVERITGHLCVSHILQINDETDTLNNLMFENFTFSVFIIFASVLSCCSL